MGRNDNRRSKKMRQRIGQRKYHARIARQRAQRREERAAAGTAAPVKKRERKEPAPKTAKAGEGTGEE